MTHKQLVQRMAHWLKFNQKYTVVAAELRTQNMETPDLIAFRGAGGSTLIECKVSRSDFLADKAKLFRKFQDMGMGDMRYYATLPDIIKPEEIPAGWGLIELRNNCVWQVVKPTPIECCKRAEVKVLMSIIRRLEISTAVFVRQEDDEQEAAA